MRLLKISTKNSLSVVVSISRHYSFETTFVDQYGKTVGSEDRSVFNEGGELPCNPVVCVAQLGLLRRGSRHWLA
jgi:hypothetical protein